MNFARRVTANFLFWQLNSAQYTVHLRMFDDDQAVWGASDVVSTGDVVKDTMRKEHIIKYVELMSSLALSNLLICKPGISSLFKMI